MKEKGKNMYNDNKKLLETSHFIKKEAYFFPDAYFQPYTLGKK
jgi:hypothetical protein